MWKDTKIWLSAVEHHNRNIDVFTTVKRRHSLTPLDRLSILRIYMKKKIKAERHTSNPKSRMRHHHKLNEKREGATTRTLRSSTGKLLLSFRRQETRLVCQIIYLGSMLHRRWTSWIEISCKI